MYGTIRICIELLKRDRAIGRVMKLLGDLYYLAFFMFHFVIRLSVIELLGYLVLSIGVLMELLKEWVDKLPDG